MSKYFGYEFICEKMLLCQSKPAKKYIDPILYAKEIIEGKPQKIKEEVTQNGKVLKVL